MDKNSLLGKKIANARKNAGLSQRKLSRLANINHGELSKIEAGKRKNPNPIILCKISKYININYIDLMYIMGLGVEINPSNLFIKDYYYNLNDDELYDHLINIVGIIKNNEKLVLYCNEIINKDNLTQIEKDLLLYKIKDINYQIKNSHQIVEFIINLKLERRNKKVNNKYFFEKDKENKESDIK